MEYWPYVIAALGIAAGGFLKGATGVGAPVVGVPILAMVFDLPKAVAIFSVINLISNVWQGWAYRKDATDTRFVWWFAAAGGAGAMVRLSRDGRGGPTPRSRRGSALREDARDRTRDPGDSGASPGL